MALRLKTDWILFSTIMALVCFGSVMVYSASSVMAQINMGSSYYFALRQVFWVVAALALMMTLKKTNYRLLQHPGVAFAAVGLVMMLLIVVYFVDVKQHRWIRMGFVGLQPSELAKPALVLFLAFFISLRSRATDMSLSINHHHTLLPAALAVGLLTAGVVVADLGNAVVLMVTAAVIFFVAGLEWRFFAMAVVIALFAVVFAIASKPYRLARIVGYADPGFQTVNALDQKFHWNIHGYLNRSLTTKDASYQVKQSRIAVGAGGVTGQGLMQGKQKLFYLPEAHTDFIYAVVGEEFGLLGSSAVLVGFVVLLWRGIRATVLIPDEFGRYLALGLTTMLVVQGMMNMSVVLGIMPTKGIPLPMISFGGSSLVCTLASLGLLLNVAEHAG